MAQEFRVPTHSLPLLTEAARAAHAHGAEAASARGFLLGILSTVSRLPTEAVASLEFVGIDRPCLRVTLTPTASPREHGEPSPKRVLLECPVERAFTPDESFDVNGCLLGLAQASLEQARASQQELQETSRGIVALYAEIDAHSRAEKAATTAAQELARQWQVTFDTVTKAILVCDADGNVVRANRSAVHILGQDLNGRALVSLLAERLRMPRGPDLRLSAREMELPEAVAGRRLCLHVDPIVMDGVWNGAVVQLQDVTEQLGMRQELEERARRLQDADRRKDEYIAMLGHELRNPIATIDAAVQTLSGLRQVADDATAGPLLKVLKRHGRNVQRLVDDLLDVSRIKQGKVVLRCRPVNLAELVSGIVRDMQPRATAAGHRLSIETPGLPLRVSADTTRMEQVITNLIDNAIKYTPNGGAIDVSVSRTPEGEARVQVTDSGVGFERDHILAAFEAFVQFDRGSDRAAGGMGLGLSLVKSLVQLHGGRVQAQSLGRGRGSTFEVYLPCLAVPRTAELRHRPRFGASDVPSSHQQQLTGTRLLLVEDNLDLLELTAARLENRGFHVRQARHAREALQMVREDVPDVLVTDIGLPGLDGFELASELKALRGMDSCLRVALSGYGPPPSPERRHLFDAYLVKPLDVAKLVDFVSTRRLERDTSEAPSQPREQAK